MLLHRARPCGAKTWDCACFPVCFSLCVCVCVCVFYMCVCVRDRFGRWGKATEISKGLFCKGLGTILLWNSLTHVVFLCKLVKMCVCVCFEYLNAFFSFWVSAHMFLSVVIHFKSLCTPVHLSVCVFVGSSMCSPTGSLWEASGQ